MRSDRQFRFDVEPHVVWDAIGQVDLYHEWWPWLVEFDARGLESGDVWRCAVKPPLPYTLRFAIELVDVEKPNLVTGKLSGDLKGTAGLEIAAAADGSGGSDLRLTSALGPSGFAFRLFASAARPLARYGHDWILDTGAAQFAKRAFA